MPSIGRQFGNREGVPRSKEALAALGMDIKGHKGFRGDRGSQGPDDIELSADEQKEARESEKNFWDMKDVCDWGERIGITREKMREVFELRPDGYLEFSGDKWLFAQIPHLTEMPPNLMANNISFESTGLTILPESVRVGKLDLRYSQVTTIPENYEGESLCLKRCPIEVLPPGIKISGVLDLSRTKITEIPPDVEAKVLELSSTDVSVLPEGLRVQKVGVKSTKIVELPQTSSIKQIVFGPGQYVLIEEAKRKGIEVKFARGRKHKDLV